MDELRKLLALSYQENISTHLFIGPSHARQWETIAASGLWSQFEDWKRKLVRINEEEATKAHKVPLPLWDFSGYNSITSEEVPATGDTQTRMRYYFESSHYTPAAGNLVLERIFDAHIASEIVPSDFGVRLSALNLEQHLVRLRNEREQYRQRHPADVLEIESLAQEVREQKHCGATQNAATHQNSTTH